MLPKILSSTLLCVAGFQSSALFAQERPNVVFVFPDQWRGSALESKGIEPVKTPRLTQFEKESISFTQAVSNYPVCSPYRAMLMSGQWPFKNNVWGNCQSITAAQPGKCELPDTTICFSDVFKAHGYATAYIGKWHLDAPQKPYVDCANNRGGIAWNEWCPPHRRHGFDYWYAYGTYDDHMNPLYWATDSKRNEFTYANEYGPKHEVDRALDFLSQRPKDKPFLMVISMNPPHTGYSLVPQKYKQMYKDLDVESVAQTFKNVLPANTPMGKMFRKSLKNYYAQMTAVDYELGRLLDALEKQGLKDNTIVIFTSDHGDCMGMNGVIGKNAIYETAMRVPLMIRYPKALKSAQTSMLINTPDLYPTMLGLCGLDSAIPTSVQGINYAQTLLDGSFNGAKNQPYLFITDGQKDDNVSLQKGRRGIRNLRYSYEVRFDKTGNKIETLFDREKDPYQLTNIARESPQLCDEFYKQTLENARKMGDLFGSKITQK